MFIKPYTPFQRSPARLVGRSCHSSPLASGCPGSESAAAPPQASSFGVTGLTWWGYGASGLGGLGFRAQGTIIRDLYKHYQ